MSWIEVLAAVVFICNCLFLIEIWNGLRQMRQLRDIPVGPWSGKMPKVSMIVPACNEAETIRPALESLMDQDYGNVEIIVVNDRSTDDTAAVLASMAAVDHQVKVVTISELPAGWLGKAHALQVGAEAASGDILVFTDADIVMESTTLSRAVGLLEREGLDHLSLFFQNVTPGWLLNGMILDMASGILLMFKPWRVRQQDSRYFVGVGAFNMVRTSVYQACGRHERIRLQPIDDVMLGKVIKGRGFRQDCLLGHGMITVAWYAGAGEMITGLMKNVFAMVHYRAWLTPVVLLLISLLAVLPLAGIFWASGLSWLFFFLTVVLRLTAFAWGAKVSRMPLTASLGGLIAPVVSGYILARATRLTLKNKGIYWRGSFYSLADLRSSEPLMF